MRKFAILILLIATLPLRAADSLELQPYTRIASPDTNTTRLEIALRKFVPKNRPGPVIWLAAVMHIGEPAYYQELQRFLDTQNVVLYEGINPDAHPHHVHEDRASTETPAPKMATKGEYSFQSSLARSLGLVFQLEAIDYDRTNFLNSDLTVRDIQRIMAGGHGHFVTNAAPTNTPLSTLLDIMDGSSFLGSLFKTGLGILADSPKLQAVAKLTLIETIGRLKGDMSDVQGLPEDWKHLIQVLIHARDENLINDLHDELQKLPVTGSISVFYGAGHMEDLEKRVTSELGYHAVSQKWLPAFSVDLRQTGMSPFEAQWMRNIINQQMKDIQQPAGTNR